MANKLAKKSRNEIVRILNRAYVSKRVKFRVRGAKSKVIAAYAALRAACWEVLEARGAQPRSEIVNHGKDWRGCPGDSCPWHGKS